MNAVRPYDLVIVGGGMVGASLAIALSGQGLRMALIEAHALAARVPPGYDDRGIALAYGSRRIFDALGLWDAMSDFAEPIHDIHVSDRGHFGVARLSAADEAVPALGYVITAHEMGQVLLARLLALADLDILAPVSLTGFSDRGDRVSVQLQGEDGARQIECRLLVAADGSNSPVRERLQLPTHRWHYGQSAVVSNVTPGTAHRNRAFERFTNSGPLALLPMRGQRCALVWTVRDDQLEDLLGLGDEDFLDRLQGRFGFRLGRFERVGLRSAYPLGLLRARESVRGRVVVIGNAAHSLHPIAGQGFNLGIRDVAVLAEVAYDAHRVGADIGSAEVLRRYSAWRSAEQRGVAMATDALARLFSNPLKPLRLARNLGLCALEGLPWAKHGLARAAMGLSGALPRLARGVALDKA